MPKIILKNFGPIQSADIELGDMTVLVGPQATGKSLFLQLFKLLQDTPDIVRSLKSYGFDWSGDVSEFQALYFGEGLDQLWSKQTKIIWEGNNQNLESLLEAPKSSRQESVFLVPAQRVLTLQNGWPRNFISYEMGDPYVLKRFSENIRQYMDKGLGSSDKPIFPQVGRFKKELRDLLAQDLFRQGQVQLGRKDSRKRMMLEVNKNSLPFMSWSAGQKEFTPLMLGLYWLMPPSKSPKKLAVNWVIIEEPEMGLHPRALSIVMLFCLELLSRGYKVILSTHASQILDMVWAMREIQQLQGNKDDVLSLFSLPQPVAAAFKPMAEAVLKLDYKTWFFEPQPKGVVVKDISGLDPGSDEAALSTWGELTDFPSRASDVVADLYQRTQN